MAQYSEKLLLELGQLVADGIDAMATLDGNRDYTATGSGVKFDYEGKTYVVTVSPDWLVLDDGFAVVEYPVSPDKADDAVTEADLSH